MSNNDRRHVCKYKNSSLAEISKRALWAISYVITFCTSIEQVSSSSYRIYNFHYLLTALSLKSYLRKYIFCKSWETFLMTHKSRKTRSMFLMIKLLIRTIWTRRYHINSLFIDRVLSNKSACFKIDRDNKSISLLGDWIHVRAISYTNITLDMNIDRKNDWF